MTQAQRIFIGDVQGCSEELEALVKRAEKAYGSDFVLWVAGDLVNRGPGNLPALALVRDLFEQGRAQIVLGNHEIFLIAVALGVRELRPSDSIGDVLACEDADDWIDWLRGLPLVVPGEIDGHRFVMLHASSHPDWSFDELLARSRAVSERLAGSRRSARELLAGDAGPGTLGDDLGRLTRCRTIAADGAWSSFEPEGSLRPWHAVWSERAHDFGIVYGHWARQGLHFADGLRGLDTGCVHHGRGRDGFLTAWLPDSAPPKRAGQPFGVPDDRMWQVPARRRYYTPETPDTPEDTLASEPG